MPRRVPDRVFRFLRYARRRTEKHVFEYGVAGKRRKVQEVKRGFVSAAVAASLDPRLVTSHVLCHTCLSYLANSGMPLFKATACVDVDMDTAERAYIHHDRRHDDVRDLLSRGGRAGCVAK